jgi:hypothetical protein
MEKRIIVAILMFVYSTASFSQDHNRERIKGLVVFDHNDKEGLAMVTEKDTVTVLFKVVFRERPNQSFPPRGIYQVSYSRNHVQFDDVNRSVTYAFVVGNIAIHKSHKEQFYLCRVKSLAKINPASYPWVEK